VAQQLSPFTAADHKDQPEVDLITRKSIIYLLDTTNMTSKVPTLEEADLSDFVEVDDAAMKDYPYAQAMNTDTPPGVDRKQLVHEEMKKHSCRKRVLSG
jgi:hypothetical protein